MGGVGLWAVGGMECTGRGRGRGGKGAGEFEELEVEEVGELLWTFLVVSG